jgi:hypothetical protein
MVSKAYQIRIRLIIRPTISLVQSDLKRNTSIPDFLAQPTRDIAVRHRREQDASRRLTCRFQSGLPQYDGTKVGQWREAGTGNDQPANPGKSSSL